jgi:hypothetical protein
MSASLTVPRTGKPLYFKIQLFIREPDNLSMNFSGTFLLALILSLVKKKRGEDYSPSPQPSPLKGEGAYREMSFMGKERARINDPGPCCSQLFKEDYFSSSSS